ncbi:MAG: hypothetical protein J1F35_03545 [Erysipelotrichales bacterium]|nr:hypothetical protein [Erysipelotrichales bacterium]
MINTPYKSVVDINSTFKRLGRYPLDQDSLFSTYTDAKAEIDKDNSNFYKGQIFSILAENRNTSSLQKDNFAAVPYIVQTSEIEVDGINKTSYLFERIATVSYLDYLFEDQGFAKRIEIGYNLTGVGRWYDYQSDGLGAYYTSTFAEIFNDYNGNIARSNYSHVEGSDNEINLDSDAAHVEGNRNTLNFAPFSHAEGSGNTISGQSSHAEGDNNEIIDTNFAHVGGQKNVVETSRSNTATGSFIHGFGNLSRKEYSTIFGNLNTSTASYALIHGYSNKEVLGDYSHVEGAENISTGKFSHVEGVKNVSEGAYSHAEGVMTYTSGAYSHAEGSRTYTSADYSHAEGRNTYTIGAYSHSEGENTYTWGRASHAEGANTWATGDWALSTGYGSVSGGTYSISTGYYTETKNSYEATFGRFSRSYEGGENGWLRYCDIDMKESGKSIFTIGDGQQEDEADWTYRHNIIAIHENGDSIKASGKSYFVDEVYAPVSYSYVESLGITAYLTTILSALLANPEYSRPSVSMNANGTWTTSTVSSYHKFGTSINQYTQFRSTYVVPNYNDYDPKYGTALGNRLGYSTAITDINYTYCYYESGTSTQVSYKTITQNYVPTSPRYLSTINNLGDNVEASVDGLTYEGKLAKYPKDDTGLFNGAGILATSAQISLNSSFVPRYEGRYVMTYMNSYNYTGASQMYFQQLANKMTYIPNDGLPPTNKYLDSEYIATSKPTWVAYVRFSYYYGTLASNDITTLPLYSSGSVSGTEAWFESYDVNSNLSYRTLEGRRNPVQNKFDVKMSVSGSPKTFWFAIPTNGIYTDTRNILSDDAPSCQPSYDNMDVEEASSVNSIRTWAFDNGVPCVGKIEKYRSNSYVEQETSAGPGVLDTGKTSSDAMPIRKIRTKKKVGNTGLYYDIYYISGSGSIPTTVSNGLRFSISRIW